MTFLRRQCPQRATPLLLVVAGFFIQSVFAATKLIVPAPVDQVMTAEAEALMQHIKSHPAVISTFISEADSSQLTLSTRQAELDLAQGLTVSVENLRPEKADNSAITVWHGQVDQASDSSGKNLPLKESERGEVILAINNTLITGTVRYGTQLYRIVPLGGKLHVILKLDENRFPALDNDTVEDGQASAASDTASLERTNTTIRVLVVISNNARPWITDPQGLAAAMFTEANQGLINSNVNVRFESAGIFPVNYNERGSGEEVFDYALRDMVSNSEVGVLRETRLADTVVMLVANNALRGLAFVRSTRGSAFAVVGESAATGLFTFGHEIGHNIGANHEDGQSPPAYAHAYHKSTGIFPFRTIMSSTCQQSTCPRINFYSSPSGTWLDQPTGVAGSSDNARVLRERSAAVAGFTPELSPVVAMPTPFWDALPRPGDNSIRLAWNASQDAAGYEIKALDATDTTPKTTTANQIVISGLTDGYHRFQLRAYDSANRFSLSNIATFGVFRLPKPTGYRISRNSEGVVFAIWDPDPQGRLFPSTTTVSGFPVFPSLLNFAVIGKLPTGVTYHFRTQRHSGNLTSEPVEITTAVP